MSLSRRIAGASLLALLSHPTPPATAASAPVSSGLGVVDQLLGDVAQMLGDRERWPQAAKLLEAPELQPVSLNRLFDSCIERPTVKDRLMDQAAFIVYYEEVRYNDLRLEPEQPSRRAEQNGLKKEVLRAIEDERAELAYLLKAPPGEDATDLIAYSTKATFALRKFLQL